MRVAWFLFAGLGFMGVGCGGSSTPDDLFTSGTTGGSQGATGSGGSGDSAGSGGGAPVGAGGSGTGGQASGAGGSGGSGTAGVGMTGGTAGSGGGRAGAGGTTGGNRGGSGGTAGIAGSGNAGSVPDGGGGSGTAGSAGGPPDSGGPLHPIRCGTITCSAPDQFCCIPINNQIPRCVATGGPCPANADQVACDDRTDCPVLQICCAENPNGPGVADCRLPVNCDAQNAGQQLCDPLQMGSCFMPGLTMCLLDQQAIIPGYPYCQ